MEHFTYGNHTFILTHGKDSKYMNRGLPFELNPTAINFINDYIEHYEIKTKYIHLEKGDLHRVGYSRTKKFDYRNYMSFAPPSAWVQHNFGDCYSGYSIQVVPKWNDEISHTDYFFELNKKYYTAARLGNPDLLTQLSTCITIYREELAKRHTQKLKDADNDLGQLINVD